MIRFDHYLICGDYHYENCVGGFIPLKGVIKDKEYSRIESTYKQLNLYEDHIRFEVYHESIVSEWKRAENLTKKK